MNDANPITTSSAVAITHAEAHGLARAAYGRYVRLLETLQRDDWARPTDCADWTVREMAGHMLGAMRAAASVRELLSQQREVKRRHAVDGGNETDVMTAVQVGRTSDLTPDALVAESRALVEPAARGRHRTPGLARRFVTFPVDIGPTVERWTLGYLNDVILTRDAWMHGIDLARAVDVVPELTAEVDGRIVADVVAEWAHRHGADYDLLLTGPAGGHFKAGRSPADRLELDAVEFCRILSGRAAGTGLLDTPVPF